MQRSLRQPLRLLAVAGTVAAALIVLAPAPTQAYIPACGASITYFSDAAKTNEVGRCDVTPSECGCVETCYGSHGRYYSWTPYSFCG